jgi:basic membrane protein A
MTYGFVPTRRCVVGGLGIGAALLASGRVRPAHAAPKPVTVGFIYVGPRDDYGYNQAHAEGAAAIKSMPGITILEEGSCSSPPSTWSVWRCA